MTIKALVAYAFLINLISFIYMYVDKQKARRGDWRIPERSLFMLALAGGSIGIFIAMRLFRHKTKHLSFKIGIPMIFLLQIILIGYYL
ncbi:MAG: DUF1294 domain-containing protein [Anaerobacillus sp.]|uniref:DUF1294 domain-containing protein n=1 Tax=Anaerobacillus sp. TaxID=1872506 RepID=UPI00391B7F3D